MEIENLLSHSSHIRFQMSLVGSKRVAPVRRASPSRNDVIGGSDTDAEQTFQQKLQEIKKMRMSTTDEKERDKVVPKKVQTVNGLKTFLKRHGDWVEVVSKSGKVYYYNKRTLVNQWKKPEDWLREEERLNNPPLPPQQPPQQLPQPPPQPPPPEDDEETGKLKLKLMTMKKLHKRLKNPDANLPRAYQKNQKRLDESDSDTEERTRPKLTISNAFENPEEGEQDGQQKLAKLDAEDEIGHLKIPEPVDDDKKPTEAISADTIAAVTEQKDARKFNPRISGPERAANLAEGCAAQLAFKNISTLPNPEKSLQNAGSGNPTYFTEYNLPCTLRRCKFPKEQDVLHELKQNKTKRRTFIQPPMMGDLDSKLSHLAQEAQMEQFMSEVKNYNNHDRLMTSRMDNVLVYKIPDDVWER